MADQTVNATAAKVSARYRWKGIEVVGLAILLLAIVMLFVAPDSVGDLFNAMFTRAEEVVVKVFLTGSVGTCIMVSVMIGRILERLGLTDALLRVFVPITARLGINSAVVVPAVYNILGDINAAGRIAGPVLKQAGATKDEQKIAIATMVQSQQSFSTFTLGLVALTAAGVNAFPVVILAVFAPLVLAPLILKLTIYRRTKRVSLAEMPRFTPDRPFLATLFGGAREGAELLFLLIIPAVAVIYSLIGALDFLGMWAPIEKALSASLTWLRIEPQTGIVSILAAPTAAMGMLIETARSLPPALVVGSFTLACSGLPLSVVFGQIPAVWPEISDLSEREALEAAVVGMVMRFISAWAIALFLTPLIS